MAKKTHSFAFSSQLDSNTPTKQVVKADGTSVTLYALPILPASPFRTTDSRSGIEFSYDAQQLIDDYRARGRRLPLDIEHNTERGGDTRARGWTVDLTTDALEPGLGLVPEVLYGWYELTPLGLQEHNDKLYGYTSGVASGFWIDETHAHFTRIKSNARTNNPATEVPFSFCAEDDEDAPGEAGYTRENASSGDDPAMLKAILEALGLTAETDEPTALSAITALKEAADKAALASRIDTSDVAEGFTGQFVAATRVEAVETKLTALTAELTAAQAEATALKTQLTAAETTVQELRAAETERLAVAAVDAAIAAGKVEPQAREKALRMARADRESFSALFSSVEPLVSTSRKTVDTVDTSAQEQLTASQRHYVTKVLGASEEDYIRGSSL